jgi:uncharacterized membrane protein required for colicin V production
MAVTFAQVFDIGAACVLGFFVVKGVLRGLTGEILSMMGLVAGVVCAWMFTRPLADAILLRFPNWDRAVMNAIYGAGANDYVGAWSRTITEAICSVVLFMAVSLVSAAAAKILRRMVRAADLSLLDHLLGAFSGAARAFFLALLVYGGVTIFSSIIPGEWMRESVAMRITAAAWPAVSDTLTKTGLLRPDSLAPITPSLNLPSLNLPSFDALPLNALPLDALPSVPGL